MSRPTDLEDLVATWRAEAAVLRRHGATAIADALERCAAEAEGSAFEWLRWLDEGTAMLFTGHKRETLRNMFRELESRGLARLRGGHRQYRRCALRRRADVDAARAAGARAAEEHAA